MRHCDVSTMGQAERSRLVELIRSKSKEYESAQPEKRVLPLSYICLKSWEFRPERPLE
jgi:hypothetical protein